MAVSTPKLGIRRYQKQLFASILEESCCGFFERKFWGTATESFSNKVSECWTESFERQNPAKMLSREFSDIFSE